MNFERRAFLDKEVVQCKYTGLLTISLHSQKWLAVISLNHPSGKEFGSGENREKARRKLGMHNKYETKALHWNPHSTKQHLLAATVEY